MSEVIIRPFSTQSNDSDKEYWVIAARKARFKRNLWLSIIILFLSITSLPVLIPYFWMFTISISAKTGGVESHVLWRSIAVIIPAILFASLGALFIQSTKWKIRFYISVVFVSSLFWLVLVGSYLHIQNFRFFWEPNFVQDLEGRFQATVESQFPWVWTAFANSLLLAFIQTLLVVTISTLSGYYLSRFSFSGRSQFLQSLLVLHAFPAMTLIIPIFLLMHWSGLLDTFTGLVLVIVTLELPFSIFIMKGFFDAVPWEVEMSALSDGATRRRAFIEVVLPQVKVGMIAIGIFSFIKGWEEYVFVRTLLFEKSNWTMSLYLFWVSDDIMGVDYGVVAAVAVFYVVPSLLLYVFCQKYLVQMSIGGVKG